MCLTIKLYVGLFGIELNVVYLFYWLDCKFVIHLDLCTKLTSSVWLYRDGSFRNCFEYSTDENEG